MIFDTVGTKGKLYESGLKEAEKLDAFLGL